MPSKSSLSNLTLYFNLTTNDRVHIFSYLQDVYTETVIFQLTANTQTDVLTHGGAIQIQADITNGKNTVLGQKFSSKVLITIRMSYPILDSRFASYVFELPIGKTLNLLHNISVDNYPPPWDACPNLVPEWHFGKSGA